jgi:putative PIN family toxin of toxin-antitoxin system
MWLDDVFDLVTSEPILTELSRVFELPYFRGRLGTEQAAANLLLLREAATVVPVAGIIAGIAAHHSDDAVIETAVAGHADYLVTGDYALLRLGSFEGITILSARDFFDLLQRDDAPPSSS